jgi:hypothetical protein
MTSRHQTSLSLCSLWPSANPVSRLCAFQKPKTPAISTISIPNTPKPSAISTVPLCSALFRQNFSSPSQYVVPPSGGFPRCMLSRLQPASAALFNFVQVCSTLFNLKNLSKKPLPSLFALLAVFAFKQNQKNEYVDSCGRKRSPLTLCSRLLTLVNNKKNSPQNFFSSLSSLRVLCELCVTSSCLPQTGEPHLAPDAHVGI